MYIKATYLSICVYILNAKGYMELASYFEMYYIVMHKQTLLTSKHTYFKQFK